MRWFYAAFDISYRNYDSNESGFFAAKRFFFRPRFYWMLPASAKCSECFLYFWSIENWNPCTEYYTHSVCACNWRTHFILSFKQIFSFDMEWQFITSCDISKNDMSVLHTQSAFINGQFLQLHCSRLNFITACHFIVRSAKDICILRDASTDWLQFLIEFNVDNLEGSIYQLQFIDHCMFYHFCIIWHPYS